jgi:hypothetical protein
MRLAQALPSEGERHTVSSSIRCGPDKLGCGCLYCNEIPVETALKHCVSSKAKGPGSGQGLYDSVSASSAHAIHSVVRRSGCADASAKHGGREP